ncbi:MAG: NifU family protein [Alphaproteobacteria bacterium]|nr:NifU family protein [Alphaproteobacteria bacterium]
MIADLEQALARADAVAPTPAPGADEADREATGRPGDGLAARIRSILEERIHPLVADRGGDVVLRDCADGVVTLGIVGSPGASVPLRSSIGNLIRHYAPEVTAVRFATTLSEAGPSPTDGAQLVLDELVNPAVASHGGVVRLVELKENVAHVRFEGRCQGCAMADVTLRQGVEPMIREQLPDIVAVVDATDHAGGRDPYFKTKKGAT